MTKPFNQSLIDGDKPYWVWGPLVFSSFYFLPLIFSNQHFTLVTSIASVVIFMVFLLLYQKAAHSQGEQALPIILLMLTLCTFGTAITPGTQSLFGFIAFFCGFNFNVKKGAIGLMSIISGVLISAYSFDFVQVYFIAPAVIVSSALFFMGQAERKDRIHSQQEKQSQAAIAQLATIAERERIARDLHDLIGHSLTSIALKAELAHKYLCVDNLNQAKHEVNEVSTLSRDILSQVRQAVSGLKSKSLNAQVTELKNKLINHNFTVHVTNNLKKVSPMVESHLVLILTEAVTNILKHSQGNTVTIELSQSKSHISLRVQDNGHVSSLQFGNGLQGIKERCEQLKGSLTINEQQGFSLIISIPEAQYD